MTEEQLGWKHQRALDLLEVTNRMDGMEKEINWLKQSLEKRDKRLEQLEQQQDAFRAERENNLKASRNVIIGALVSLLVGVTAFLIQKGL